MKSFSKKMVELTFDQHMPVIEKARRLGIHRDTVRRYRDRIHASGLDREALLNLSDKELDDIVLSRKTRASALVEPDWSEVASDLKKKNATKLFAYGEYKRRARERGASEAELMSRSRFYDKLSEKEAARDVEFRHSYIPGQLVQFDFAGDKLHFYDWSNRLHKFEIALGLLPYSQYLAATLVPSQSLQDSVEAVVQIFTQLGGVPSDIIVDNFKAAVVKARKGKTPAILNQNFKFMLDYYGVYPDPARKYRARDKGNGEAGVGWIERDFFPREPSRHCRSFADAQKMLRESLDRLNNRTMQLSGLCPRETFEEIEKPVLRPLPTQPYEFGEWIVSATVPRHYRLMIKGAEYSVPHGLIGECVNAKITAKSVLIYHEGEVVAVHERSTDGTPRLSPSHMPENHRAAAERNSESILRAAGRHSTVLQAFLKAHLERNKNTPSTASLAERLIRQLRELSIERLEGALQEALDRGVPTSAMVDTLLARRQPIRADAPKAPRYESKNVRGADYYRDEE